MIVRPDKIREGDPPPGDAEPVRPTLRAVLDALGSSLLHVLSAPRGLDVRVGSPAIYDRLDDLPRQADGILLLIGAHAASLATLEAVRAAADAGFAAVVMKLHDRQPQAVIDASLESQIAVLVAADELPWRRLDALLTAAIDVGGGGRAPMGVGDMFSLANAVASLLGGAVAIEDAGRNVLAYSNVPGQRIDEVRRQGILARHVPELPKHDQQYREVFAAPGVVHHPSDPSTGELPRAAIAVRAGNEVLGSIWIVEEHPSLVDDSHQVLVDAAKIASLLFLRARIVGGSGYHVRGDALRGLLEGRVEEKVASEVLGLHADGSFSIVGFTCSSAEGQVADSLIARLAGELASYLSGCRPDASWVVVERTVYALDPSLKDEGSALRFAAEAARRAESALQHPVRAAVAQGVTDATPAPHLRDEIDEALRVLSTDSSAPSVASVQHVYNQIQLARVGDSLGRFPQGLHASTEALREYDRERGTAYGETLLAYFRANGDASLAAKAIRVHPNTVRYRLRRATALFGLDLEDPDERLLVWMQLRLHDGVRRSDAARIEA